MYHALICPQSSFCHVVSTKECTGNNTITNPGKSCWPIPIIILCNFPYSLLSLVRRARECIQVRYMMRGLNVPFSKRTEKEWINRPRCYARYVPRQNAHPSSSQRSCFPLYAELTRVWHERRRTCMPICRLMHGLYKRIFMWNEITHLQSTHCPPQPMSHLRSSPP